jgi:hypothetical protein
MRDAVTTTPANAAQGYTGRFLAKYIHDNDLASEIRLVDKHLPELAWLAPEFKNVCTRERFVQADASRERTSYLASRRQSALLLATVG